MNDLISQLKNGSVLQGCQNGDCEKKKDDDMRELSGAEVEAIVGGLSIHGRTPR